MHIIFLVLCSMYSHNCVNFDFNLLTTCINYYKFDCYTQASPAVDATEIGSTQTLHQGISKLSMVLYSLARIGTALYI